MASGSQYSSFWLPSHYYEPINKSSPEFAIRLASVRRGIANFVRLVTGQDIPVVFSTGKQSYTSQTKDGENRRVVISASDDPAEYDEQVGTALHEATHIILSNWNSEFPESTPLFDLLGHIMIGKMDTLIAGFQKDMQRLEMKEHQFRKLLHKLVNYLEDRRIDSWQYRHAVGYQGYYLKMYDACWHHPDIGELLEDEETHKPTVRNYEFHVINMTNERARPEFLPELDKIWATADLGNIRRFDEDAATWAEWQQTKHQAYPTYPKIMVAALGILGKILKNAVSLKDEEKKQKQPEQAIQDPNNLDVPDDEDEVIEQPKTRVDEINEDQTKFMEGEVEKKPISPELQPLLEAMEEAGAAIKPIESPVGKLKVIVYHKLTKALLDTKDFPFRFVNGSFVPTRDQKMVEIIREGERMGNLLAHHLKIMNEEAVTTYPRQKYGKLDKRRLADLGMDQVDVFQSSYVGKLKPVNLHFTVDASTSMREGEKWYRSMRVAVALAKAAEKVPMLHVVVSLRGGVHIPEVLIAYDSKVDKFLKIKTLWAYLWCNSNTPEGLCYAALLNEILNTDTGSRQFFVNISDGMPYFTTKPTATSLKGAYAGKSAWEHTRQQVDAIRKAGIRVLSYFVKGGKSEQNTEEAFRLMYGQDAAVIDVSSISYISNSLNAMFVK